MAVNDKISQADYNSIRNKVVPIIGTGSSNSGYGQFVVSSAVAEGQKVSYNDWMKLGYDIINCYKHQQGTNPAVAVVAEGNTIRYSTTFTPAATDSPVTQLDSWANTVVSNKFTIAPSQSYTTNVGTVTQTWPGVYGNTWSVRIQCTVTVTFSNADQARYFFNSGGEIRFTSSRSGGQNIPQNTSWTNLLSSVGTVAWGGNKPGTGTSPNDNLNYYRCSNIFSNFYSASASTPYGSNSYILAARTPGIANNSSGTASSIEFQITWNDAHVGDSGGPDFVDGTLV